MTHIVFGNKAMYQFIIIGAHAIEVIDSISISTCIIDKQAIDSVDILATMP